jgi:hypothetical protein
MVEIFMLVWNKVWELFKALFSGFNINIKNIFCRKVNISQSKNKINAEDKSVIVNGNNNNTHIYNNKSEEYTPVQMFSDLSKLLPIVQAFSTTGSFCESIEHRAPIISNKDGDGCSVMSYAQRKSQFKKICKDATEAYTKICFSGFVKENFPETFKTCNVLLSELQKIDAMINKLIICLQGPSEIPKDVYLLNSDSVQNFSYKLSENFNQLNKNFENERQTNLN